MAAIQDYDFPGPGKFNTRFVVFGESQACSAASGPNRLRVNLFDVTGRGIPVAVCLRRLCTSGAGVIPPKKSKVSSAPIAATISHPLRRADRLYRLALWLAFALCLAQAISLPVLITFDGYWYARLAEVLGTSRFAAEWDYLRTPFFPILLKLSCWLFGRQPAAICVLQSAFGFGGICLLGAMLKRSGRPVEAAIVVLLLVCFPTLVTYEHALLTEAGTFFFIALLLYFMTAPVSRPQRRVFELAGVLALGFYHRSSLLYLSPAVAVLYALASLKQRKTSDTLSPRTNARIFAEGHHRPFAAILGCLPLAEQSPRDGADGPSTALWPCQTGRDTAG